MTTLFPFWMFGSLFLLYANLGSDDAYIPYCLSSIDKHGRYEKQKHIQHIKRAIWL